MHFPLAVHVSQATLDAMLRDVITSLRKHGIRKFVLFNAHGGNDFSPLVRQIQCDMDVYVFVVNWWTVGDDRYDAYFDKPDDHAGEFETSVALALFEDLVELEHAGDGRPRRFAFEALRNGWAKTSRDFAKVNDQCAVGDPSGASAQRGQAYLELVYDRVSAFLAALASAPIDEHFPMASENRDEPS
jgi:creatinine amidohydrolase